MLKDLYDKNFIPNYKEIENISSRVSRLLAPNPSPYTFHGTGTYIIGKKNICIIDPGPKIHEHVELLLNSLNKKLITHILVTHNHSDHSAAAKLLKEKTGATIYGYVSGNNVIENTNFEAAYDNNFVPDISLKDGQLIKGEDWTLQAIHTPGHTSDHLCFGLEEEQILFCGDHVMGWATTVILPPDGDMGEYINSLKKILKYDYKVFFPTHGNLIDNPNKYVRALIAHRKMREKQIVEELKKNKLTINEMLSKFYSTTNKNLWPAASMTLKATLLLLQKKGIARNSKNENNEEIWSYVV